MKTAIDTVKLSASILVCCMVGFASSFFTRTSVDTWYVTLQKPGFTPPGWVFAPVWFGLYTLMGIAAFLVWRKGLGEPAIRRAMAVFLLQLTLNFLWSAAFFAARSPLAGLVVITVLWAAILLTIFLFRRISTAATLLLVPYICWVSFAAVLNLQIYRLN